MKSIENNKELEEFRKLYNIQDTNVILRLLDIKSILARERNIDMGFEDLLSFLDNAMNYDEMQIWLTRQNLAGIELSLNDKLKKFFELRTNEEILFLYDIGQNYNEKNFENVMQLIKGKSLYLSRNGIYLNE